MGKNEESKKYKEYLKTQMTDKDAAKILRDVQKHGNINMGRGNMKSMRILRINMAFARAIEKLEEDSQ